MKKLLISAAALIALVGPALSQPQSWTGIYGGLDIGGSSGNANLWVPIPGYPVSRNAINNGVIGGGFVGYNYQISNYVLGLQVGLDGASIGNTRHSAPIGADVFQTSFNQNWIASIDGRLGWVFGSIMPYAIGGVATDSQSMHVNDLTAGHYRSVTNAPLGYDLGLGIEYAITANWTARAEYRYYNFGYSAYAYVSPLVGVNYYRATLTDNVLRSGLSYKF